MRLLRREMGRQGRLKTEGYKPEKIVAEIIAEYRRVLAEKQTGNGSAEFQFD